MALPWAQTRAAQPGDRPAGDLPSGAAIYQSYCAACHGADGQGGATSLAVPDLTRLSRDNGGSFPIVEVMSRIDGYARAQPGSQVMPAFGALLEGDMVLLDMGGAGAAPVPTPERLVRLAEHLASLQRP